MMTAALLSDALAFGPWRRVCGAIVAWIERGEYSHDPAFARTVERERGRATRRDFLEGLARWLTLIFRFTSLESGLVGTPNAPRSPGPNDVRSRPRDRRRVPCVGVDHKYIAAQLQIGRSTSKKYARVFRVAGWVCGPGRDGFNVIRQPIESCDVTPKTPNGLRGLPAIRRVTDKVFAIVGELPFVQWLRDGRREARAGARAHARTMDSAPAAVQEEHRRIAMRSLREARIQRGEAPTPAPAPPPPVIGPVPKILADGGAALLERLRLRLGVPPDESG
jgi:hypothetical protein